MYGLRRLQIATCLAHDPRHQVTGCSSTATKPWAMYAARRTWNPRSQVHAATSPTSAPVRLSTRTGSSTLRRRVHPRRRSRLAPCPHYHARALPACTSGATRNNNAPDGRAAAARKLGVRAHVLRDGDKPHVGGADGGVACANTAAAQCHAQPTCKGTSPATCSTHQRGPHRAAGARRCTITRDAPYSFRRSAKLALMSGPTIAAVAVPPTIASRVACANSAISRMPFTV